MTRIAIAGAGIAGLTLAHSLRNRAEITIFEKARGVGGRMATRYAEPWQFDHGAQFFTALTEPFQAFLRPLINAGIVARWDARFAEYVSAEQTAHWQWDSDRPHYVGTPRMNAVAKHLSPNLDIRLATEICSVQRNGTGWSLADNDGNALGDFDWFVSTAPAPQSAALLPPDFAHHSFITTSGMRACFALMLGFDDPLPFDWDAAHVGEADISWMSVNNAKPDRETAPSLLIHSTNAWADAHTDDDRPVVQAHLLAVASEISGYDLSQASHIALHRWLYANLPKRAGPAALIDTDNQLAACGDWCIQGRVEAAFTSAMALADELKAMT